MTDLETADDPAAPVEERQPVVSRDRARQRRGTRGDEEAAPSRRRRLWPFGLATAVFAGALVVMVWQGYETTLDIKGGTALNSGTNPKAPGYEAQVNPTPTHLLINVTADGKLGDLELLVDNQGTMGGGVLFIPALTVVKIDDVSQSLVDVAAKKGLSAVVDDVQRALGIGITDAVQVSPAQFEQLVTPAGPITIQNPDNLTKKVGDQTTTVYPAGQLTLPPKDVAGFLSFANDGEPIVNRTARTEQVWEVWLQAVRTGGTAAAPKLAPLTPLAGGDGVDVAALLSKLGAGTVSYQQLPLDRFMVPYQGGGFAIYEPNASAVSELMARMVPFPGSAFPGQRVRVRLLNGTNDPQAALRAATSIVAANAQILVLGNASSFDVATTRVEYDSNQQIEAAKAIATKLGVGPPVPGDESDAIDVTVTLGKDFHG